MSKLNLFNSVKMTRPKVNKFDLTHDVKLSTKMGLLTPICVMECVPTDKVLISVDSFIRFAPMIAPIFHKVDVYMHYFFVPNRIMWEDWEKFITNQASGEVPYITLNSAMSDDTKKFLDYLGLPPITSGAPMNVSAFPLSAYQMVYNEYYRDQNLIPEVDFMLQSGDNSSNADLFIMRNRAWEHDYFTASLPFAQKGEAVDIPLGGIKLKEDWEDYGSPKWRLMNDTIPTGEVFSNGSNEDIYVGSGLPFNKVAYDPADTLQTESTTINDLRRAFRLQEFLEKMARGGSRLTEVLRAHFGRGTSDGRLQRPEYICGMKSPVVVSEVLNTVGSFNPENPEDPTSPPQGNMSGHAVSVGSGNTGYFDVEEHGFIIGIMSVMPKPAYQQGIPKHYLRTDPYEYYWPSFAHLGEQEVLNKEIYVDGGDPNGLFGYIPRYAEYKYIPSRVCGDFRTTLDFWHLGRKFASQPTLSKSFIECTPEDVERVFAVQNGEDNVYCHILNKISAIRPMPVFGTPML